MVSMTGKYLGSLRTQDIHIKSGNKILTDAPLDNNGRGEAFSPTDLVCAALSSCMMTLMGMLADREGIDLTGLGSEITKVMASNPRRIAEIQIVFTHSELKATEIQKQKLRNAALTCPVALSLGAAIKQTVEFRLG
jgi:putative redox protein